MDYIILGKTNLRISKLSIGTWAIGGLNVNLSMDSGWQGANDKQAKLAIAYAYDHGINFIDTADVYGNGHSEKLIGKFIRDHPAKELMVSTKVGYYKGEYENAFHPHNMRKQIEKSLLNLGRSYIDLYSLHNTNFGENDTFKDSAINTLQKFKEEGKIRYIGLRVGHVYTPNQHTINKKEQIKKDKFLINYMSPDVVQLKYNLLERNCWPNELFSLIEEQSIGLLFNKPLAQGLLCNKYSSDNMPQFVAGDHRIRKKEFLPKNIKILHYSLNDIMSQFSLNQEDLISLCFQFCFEKFENSSIVFGFKNMNQMEMNLRAYQKKIPTDILNYVPYILPQFSDLRVS